MSITDNDDLLPEYDLGRLKGGIRGRYYEHFGSGANVVIIDADLAETFPDSEAVNDALRDLLARRRREQ